MQHKPYKTKKAATASFFCCSLQCSDTVHVKFNYSGYISKNINAKSSVLTPHIDVIRSSNKKPKQMVQACKIQLINHRQNIAIN